MTTTNPRILLPERRMVSLAELRVVTDGGKRRLVGYPAIFNTLSDEIFGFREKIKPGAFRDTLARGADVRALFNHDENLVLGRTKSGTLRLAEDDKGLRMEADPPDTTYARDLLEVMDRGDVTGMSFGFRTVLDSWQTTPDGQIRTLEVVELFDVSIVTFPAYPDTTAEARSALEAALATAPAALRAQQIQGVGTPEESSPATSEPVQPGEQAGARALAEAERARRLRLYQID